METKIDWKKKLASRKFWAAIVGFVAAMAAAFGISEATAGQITSIIMAGATLIAYILGESWVDGKSAGIAEGELIAENGDTEMTTRTTYPDGTIIESTTKLADKSQDTEE